MNLVRRENLFLILILALAFYLRLPGVTWGIPDESHSFPHTADEMNFFYMVSNMEPARLDFNPEEFRFGHFVPYAVAVGLKTASVLGFLELYNSEEYYMTRLDEWGKVFIVSRLVIVFLGLLNVLAFYLLLKKLYGPLSSWLPLAGAFLLAVMPGHVVFSSIINYKAPVCLWITLAFYFLVDVVALAETRHYVLAGLCAGVAMGTCYIALPLVLFIFVAHWLGAENLLSLGELLAWPRLKRLLLAYLCYVVGFLAVMPYTLVEPLKFAQGFLTAVHFAGSRGLQIGLGHRAATIWKMHFYNPGWAIFFLGLAGLGWTFARRDRDKREILLATWVVLCTGMSLMSTQIGWDRLLPFSIFLVFPGISLLGAIYTSPRASTRHSGLIYKGAAIGLAVLVSLPTLIDSLLVNDYHRNDTVREDSSRWIEANVPEGSIIGLRKKAYYDSPDLIFMDFWHPEMTGGRYRYVVYDFDVDKLASEPSDYAIFIGRDLTLPELDHLYPEQAEFMRRLFESYEQVVEFVPRASLWGVWEKRVDRLPVDHSELHIFKRKV